MKKPGRQILSLVLILILAAGLLPGASAYPVESVAVRIIGEDGFLLNTTVPAADIADYTTDDSSGLNALDAVISATQQNGYDAGSYGISYNAAFGSYSIDKLAGLAPADAGYSFYWGSLAVSAGGAYDGNALSSHALAAGDIYIVYYDKYIGGSANYGYQSYAWFEPETASGAAGSIVSPDVMTTGYDESWNTVAAGLAGATVYVQGGAFASETPVAVTDDDGGVGIIFPEAGSYTLTLSSDYTYAACAVTVIGDGVALLDTVVTVTDGTDALADASFTLTDGAGGMISPYQIGAGTFSYRLPAGTYDFSTSADGYLPATGSLAVSEAGSQSVALTALSGYAVTITPGNSTEETVTLKDGDGAEVTPLSVSDGVYSFDLTDGSYAYTVSRTGYHSRFGSFTVSGEGQDITPTALSDTAADAAEWPAFRDFADNMATVAAQTAQGSWQASEAWSVSLGDLGDWGTLSSSNILLYDDYLYVATEHGLSKIEKNAGTLLKTSALSADPSYVPQIAYGGGKVFVTTAVGMDAFDALTMECLWAAPISTWGDYMAATPILYDESSGLLYVGDYGDANNGLGAFGGYSAIDASSGENRWILYGGAADARYWAGAVIAGDYLVFGSDSGTLCSVATDTAGYASPAGTLSVNGMIHSSVSLEGGYLYFTTSTGYIYKVSIDAGTGTLAEVSSRQFATGSGSTPVVYNGRIYVGASDGIYVLSAADLSQIAHFSPGPVSSSALLTTAYGGTVYAYFTVNDARGEIAVLSDDGTDVSMDILCTPSQAQYCLTSPIADDDGTLYFTNDSGYLFALENSGASNADKARVAVSVTPASVFDSGTYTTAFPSITVRDSGGSMVSTPAAGNYYLPVGSYTYTVSLTGYDTASGSFTVTADDMTSGSKTVSVTLTKTTTTPDTDITVTVTVRPSDDETWINSAVITVPSDPAPTVWTVIEEALDKAGLRCVKKETDDMGLFIESVNGLGVVNKAGWLYSVNGYEPLISVDRYEISDGDVILLRYTLDYTKDSDWAASKTGSSDSGSITAEAESGSGGAVTATIPADELDAFNEAIENGDAEGTASIVVDLPAGTSSLALTVPSSTAAALRETGGVALCIETDFASLTFDPAALQATAGEDGDLLFRISQLDTDALDDEAASRIGDRPAYSFSVSQNGTAISDFGGGSVQISIPYTPAADEDPNAIVVYYIDGTGALQEIRGAYHAETDTVDFTVTHFSAYAVGYNKLRFDDVADTAWYADAVTFCAARGITEGTGGNLFSPDATLTRGQFVVLLMRAYGLAPDSLITDNFSDAGDTYYTAYLSAAKRLGISNGVGDNRFAPEAAVSRQDMFTMLYRALESLGELPTTDNGKTLSDFPDGSDISDYAQSPVQAFLAAGIVNGSDGKLEPFGGATRAQTVQTFYKLLSA